MEGTRRMTRGLSKMNEEVMGGSNVGGVGETGGKTSDQTAMRSEYRKDRAPVREESQETHVSGKDFQVHW